MAAVSSSGSVLNVDAEEDALTTSLQPKHSHVNHAQLPVFAAGFCTMRQQLLVADNRDLRLFSGAQQRRSRGAALAQPWGLRAGANPDKVLTSNDEWFFSKQIFFVLYRV